MTKFVQVDSAEGAFIGACWMIFFVVWLVAGMYTKRTVERSSSLWRVVVVMAILAFVASRAARLPIFADFVLWPYSPTVGLIADAVVAAGLLTALWARFTLGTNWSGAITFKQDHALITSGPYALARHPIYTGMLLMMLGTAILSGHAAGFGFVAFVTLSLWLKAREEEKMMIKHFPDAYPKYRARVRALVPFIL